jgi:hypothetical protein
MALEQHLRPGGPPLQPPPHQLQQAGAPAAAAPGQQAPPGGQAQAPPLDPRLELSRRYKNRVPAI